MKQKYIQIGPYKLSEEELGLPVTPESTEKEEFILPKPIR
jgi:hypothetical protein